MHDPCTVAWEIRSPIRKRSHQRADGSWWHYRSPLITIWHVDPERDGSDDSCGWAWPKATDADRERVKRLAEAEFEHWLGKFAQHASGGFDWSCYELIWWAWKDVAISHGRSKHGVPLTPREENQIRNLAANPHDNIRSLVKAAVRARDIEHLEHLLSCVDRIYRAHHRRWWQHPRWHVQHWRFQVHPWQTLRRWLLTRCARCGKRFAYGESPVSHSWLSERPRWFKGEKGLYHGACSGQQVAEDRASSEAKQAGALH